MKNKIELKKMCITSCIVIIIFLITFSILIYKQYNTYTYNFNQKIAGIIDDVLEKYPDIETLDYNYDLYKVKTGRDVEGFILAQNNNVSKYVRMKNGKLQPHHE